MMRESCNLIEQEAYLVTPNQSDTNFRYYSQLLTSLDDKLHAKNI